MAIDNNLAKITVCKHEFLSRNESFHQKVGLNHALTHDARVAFKICAVHTIQILNKPPSALLEITE